MTAGPGRTAHTRTPPPGGAAHCLLYILCLLQLVLASTYWPLLLSYSLLYIAPPWCRNSLSTGSLSLLSGAPAPRRCRHTSAHCLTSPSPPQPGWAHLHTFCAYAVSCAFSCAYTCACACVCLFAVKRVLMPTLHRRKRSLSCNQTGVVEGGSGGGLREERR